MPQVWKHSGAPRQAAVLWAAATPGRQRTLAYGVARAKRSETRARRAQALLDAVASGDPDATTYDTPLGPQPARRSVLDC